MFKMNDNMIKYDVFTYHSFAAGERRHFVSQNALRQHHTVLRVIKQALIETLWDIAINENIWQKSLPWCVFYK